MLFSSMVFIYFFLPIVLFVYYALLRKKRSLQNLFLTLASLLFYAWGGVRFTAIMLLSVFINWALALLVSHFKDSQKALAKGGLVLACVANLTILFVFKYLVFSVNTINEFFDLTMTVPQITLPIGISFFTFQAMSYVIDVYRGKGKAQKNILDVALYISLFPQLIAGPIVRYETIAEEIENRTVDFDEILDGLSRFIIGLAKKVLIANKLALFADSCFSSVETLSVASSWLGAISYTFQIFFDFSGYSDMAIGLGRMFGFRFLENFNYPYISKSITEFWRRWHISLGTWFRDYVYIPLGGSRVNRMLLVRNLFVVWLLTGIWHGANWTFVVWGLMYFILLTIEKFTGFANKDNTGSWRGLHWAYTMFFVVIGWVIFRADSLSTALSYIQTMLGINNHILIDEVFFKELGSSGLVLAAATVFSLPIGKRIQEKMNVNQSWIQILYNVIIVVLFISSVFSIVTSAYNPFIYFNF